MQNKSLVSTHYLALFQKGLIRFQMYHVVKRIILLPEKSGKIDPLEQRIMNTISEKKVAILTRICKIKKIPYCTLSRLN